MLAQWHSLLLFAAVWAALAAKQYLGLQLLAAYSAGPLPAYWFAVPSCSAVALKPSDQNPNGQKE